MRERRLLAFAVGLAFGWMLTAMLQTLGIAKTPNRQRQLTQFEPSPSPSPSPSLSPSPSPSPSRRVRLLCLIVTQPRHYATKAAAVNQTWARRCDRHAFVGSGADTGVDLPIISLKVQESRDTLWQKTWKAFYEADRRFDLEDFDFVLKADDDTFVVMENLKRLLGRFDPDTPVLAGRMFRYDGDRNLPYMSGGAGYAASRQAVRRLLDRAIKRRHKSCELEARFSEDVMAARCFRAVGVTLVDTRDPNGRETFHPLTPGDMIGHGAGKMPDWMFTFNFYNLSACMSCISSNSVSFHYIGNLYELEFLIYHLKK